MQYFDIGNHHFPSVARTALAQRLVESAPASISKVAFGSGGGEAIDIALKSARHATQRRKIVSIVKAYHGHTGLAVATGDDRFSKLFLSDRPDEFVQVPFGDVDAMEQALSGGDVAAVIMETIPATYGFPLPPAGYLEAVKDLTERYDTLYIADEVQTGLMRTGEMWGITKHGIEPGHPGHRQGAVRRDVSDRGGDAGRPRRPVARSGRLRATCRPSAAPNSAASPPSRRWRSPAAPRCGRSVHAHRRPSSPRAWPESRPTTPDWFVGIRQNGVVIGLEFDHPEGAKFVMRELYENGVWAIFSTLDPRVLQFKPGLLLSRELCDDVLDRLDAAVGKAAPPAPLRNRADGGRRANARTHGQSGLMANRTDTFVADDVDVAERALADYDLSPDSTLRLLNLSENATYAVEDADTGRGRSCACTARTTTARTRSNPNCDWLDALRRDGDDHRAHRATRPRRSARRHRRPRRNRAPRRALRDGARHRTRREDARPSRISTRWAHHGRAARPLDSVVPPAGLRPVRLGLGAQPGRSPALGSVAGRHRGRPSPKPNCSAAPADLLQRRLADYGTGRGRLRPGPRRPAAGQPAGRRRDDHRHRLRRLRLRLVLLRFRHRGVVLRGRPPVPEWQDAWVGGYRTRAAAARRRRGHAAVVRAAAPTAAAGVDGFAQPLEGIPGDVDHLRHGQLRARGALPVLRRPATCAP